MFAVTIVVAVAVAVAIAVAVRGMSESFMCDVMSLRSSSGR